MARKPATAPPIAANLSPEQARVGIPVLQRRYDELISFNVDAYDDSNGDAAIRSLINKIDDALIRVYGANTIEHQRYKCDRMHAYPGAFNLGDDLSYPARKRDIKIEINSAALKIRTAIDLLKEQVEDSGDTSSGRVVRAYDGLELHPEIARAASKLFKDSHYANAVEAAVKALNGLVRLRSGLELDGSALMEKSFSPNAPILAFNKLENQSDKDEQRGYMMMFSGAVAGLRNPRAHGFVQDKPERALEFIAFVSLLAKLLDQASN